MPDSDVYYTEEISIHAPRAGSDLPCSLCQALTAYFNPRSPCGERLQGRTSPRSRLYFNPRSPCGERQYGVLIRFSGGEFQSTLPVRGATGVNHH